MTEISFSSLVMKSFPINDSNSETKIGTAKYRTYARTDWQASSSKRNLKFLTSAILSIGKKNLKSFGSI